MSTRIRTAGNPNESGFLHIIERYWLVLCGLILLIPVFLRYLKDANTKTEINEVEETIKLNLVKNLDPIAQTKGLHEITIGVWYHDMARNLAHNLGTLYQNKPWWDVASKVRSLSENDTEIYNDLKLLINTGQVKTVSELYFFLTGKNLREDVITLLDKELLKKLPLFR